MSATRPSNLISPAIVRIVLIICEGVLQPRYGNQLKGQKCIIGRGATFEHTAHALTMTFYHDRYRLQWTQQNSTQKYTLFILAGFITWIGTVHLFLDSCPVKVPVCKRGGGILTIDLNLVPWEVQGLTVDNAGVKEVASRLARHKTSCCL